MSYIHVAQTVIDVIKSGLVTTFLIEVLKRYPAIPLKEGEKVKIRSVAAVLSTAGIFLTGIASGTITAPDIQNVLVSLISAVAAFGLSHIVYKGLQD